MADRHGNNWQPVRPMDDDEPPNTPEPVVTETPVVGSAEVGEVSGVAGSAETAGPYRVVGESRVVGEREPFRSTPIAMPPADAPSPTPVVAAMSTPPVEVTPPTDEMPTMPEASGPPVVPPVSSDTAMPLGPPTRPTGEPQPPGQQGQHPVQPQNGVVLTPNAVVPQQYWQPNNEWAAQNQWQAQNGWPTHGHGQGQGYGQWAPQPGSWPQPMVPGHVPAVVPVAAAVVQPNHRPPSQPMSAADLGDSLLIRSATVAPVAGWRRALYLVSGGRIDVGNSPAQQRRLELTAQVDRPLVGCYRVAVLSLKGGVGKTTTTATLGSTFADIRGDRVIAIDANPDRGTLGQKVPSETTATVRNLLRDMDSLERYSDVRAYTSQNVHRLEVLASDSDPAASEAFSGDDYDRTVTLLEKFYSIVITDCGTGLMHSAMESILEGADTLVVVSSGSVDGARSASATLDWLDAHGYRELVATSVAVVNAVRPRAGKVDLQKVVEHFEQRCAQVRTIPFDPHLEEGAEIELGRLRGRTRKALLEVAAAVAAGFPASPTTSRRS